MRNLFLLPCVAMLTAAAPASSAPPAVSTQAAPSEAQQPLILSGGRAAQVEEKKICKHLPTSGSRLSNRACLTAKEWKQVEDEVSR